MESCMKPFKYLFQYIVYRYASRVFVGNADWDSIKIVLSRDGIEFEGRYKDQCL
jgi:hypothetical protein